MHKIVVLRLGHRIKRDKRISTHVALVSRAMGCLKVIYSGQYDKTMEESIRKVVKNWGGNFKIEYVRDWRTLVREWKGKSVHLTMYGMPVEKKISTIRKSRDLLIIVGGEKVPPEAYKLADWNIAVTNQPHSEVAALAVFLHEYFQGRELSKDFRDAMKRVVPQVRGKKLI
jgi:tRNA (cytidine56-2'-O)-methyltransferase